MGEWTGGKVLMTTLSDQSDSSVVLESGGLGEGPRERGQVGHERFAELGRQPGRQQRRAHRGRRRGRTTWHGHTDARHALVFCPSSSE